MAQAGEEATPTSTPTTDADNLIQVNVKFLRETPLTLHVPPTIAIPALKAQVWTLRQEQDPHAEQAQSALRLIYRGRVLKDEHQLIDYNFVDQDTIHAVLRPTPPPPASESTSEASNTHSRENAEADHQPAGTAGWNPPINLVQQMMSATMLPGMRSFLNPSMATTGTNTSGATTNAGPPQATFMRWSFPGSGSPAPTPTPATTRQTESNTPSSTGQTEPNTPSTGVTSALVEEQAASLRRTMPALPLGNLSQPSNLSDELYALGNMTREVSDTVLAMHRQLQFVQTRLQRAHELTSQEQQQLRSRMTQLRPVLRYMSQLMENTDRAFGASSLLHEGTPPSTSAEQNPGDVFQQIFNGINQNVSNGNANGIPPEAGQFISSILGSVSSALNPSQTQTTATGDDVRVPELPIATLLSKVKLTLESAGIGNTEEDAWLVNVVLPTVYHQLRQELHVSSDANGDLRKERWCGNAAQELTNHVGGFVELSRREQGMSGRYVMSEEKKNQTKELITQIVDTCLGSQDASSLRATFVTLLELMKDELREMGPYHSVMGTARLVATMWEVFGTTAISERLKERTTTVIAQLLGQQTEVQISS